jgi:ABC-2 type transport system permease protein
MRVANAVLFAKKEFRLGPRGLMFVFIIVLPVAITLVVRLVFGDLLFSPPRLGIVDQGDSGLVSRAVEVEALEVTVYGSEDALREAVSARGEDAGLVLQPEFDALVRSGERPTLQLFLNGETSETDQTVLLVTVIDLVRELAGSPAPLTVETLIVDDGPTVPLVDRIVPLLVLLAIALAGVFLPASTIVQEREARTLHAVLVTPVRVSEVMLGKGIAGFALAFGMGALTLVLNGITAQTVSLLTVLVIASIMSVEVGLLLGVAVSDMATLFSVWKGGGIILFAPAILFLFPGAPEWIARIFPTYYFLGPLYDIVVHGATLGSQALDLGVALLICVALVPAIDLLARRMERRLALG